MALLRGVAVQWMALVLAAAPAGWAQTVTATLVGTIADSSGAALPDAVVSAVNKSTNGRWTARTSAGGDYRLPYLPPGIYQVTAERDGFRKSVADEVELQVDQTARLDLSLQVGSVLETIEVNAAAPVVSSETSSVGQVINNRQIQDLPLKGRNFYELALLSPGTTPQMPNSFVGGRRPTPGGLNAPAFYVGGAREKSNGYLVDGVDAQDPHYLTPSFFPSVDVIQEFKLLSNAYTAEYGRFAAQVSAATRAGGNEWKGSLYEFFRNDHLDAANFFDNFTGQGKAPLRYNQFGGTLGGPVSLPKLYQGKDRTFFFASYEGTRIRRGRTAQLNVPSQAQREGDFSLLGVRNNQPIFDPATTRSAGAGVIRDPFGGNRVPASRVLPFARTVLALFPAPTVDAARGNNYFSTLSDNSDNNQGLIRADHRFNDRNNVFFRYAVFDGVQSNLSPIDQGGTSTDVRTQNMAFNYVRVFTPSLLYELRAGYNRPVYLILQDGAYKVDYARQLGLKNLLTDPIGWGVPDISLTGFSGFGTDTNPTTQVSNVYHLVNHVTVLRGGHSVKFGTDQRKTNYNDRSERFVRGSFGFTGGLTGDPNRVGTTGVSVADLLLGLPLTAGGSATSLAGNFNGFSHGFFVQDDWKVGRRLTLNLGLRYDLNLRYTDVQNRLVLFDPTVPGGRLLIAGGNRAYVPGRGTIDAGVETPRGLIPVDRNNWGPRVGAAWRPFASNRTVVRAGYGIFYDIIELQDLRTFVRNPPFGEVIQLRSEQNANSSSAAVLRIAELFPASGTPASRPNVFGPGGDYVDPYYQQWNLGVQHELAAGLLVEAGYLGSKGTRLAQRTNQNQATLDADPTRPTPVTARIRYPLFGNNIRITEADGNSTYHAGFVKAEKRFAGGFSFLGSHTWSKSLDSGSLIDDNPRDIYNKRLSKGRSGFDIRHRTVVSGSWELPFGRGKARLNSGIGAAVLGGWQMNGIYTFRSGFPFTVTAQGDICNCAAAGQTAMQVGDPWAGDVRMRERWFNTAAFDLPGRGTFGSAGRNILSGPSASSLDASFFKSFAFGERVKLQFRGELFNLFNNVRFSQPGGQVRSPVYGVINGAADPRIAQLALKLSI